MYDTGAVKREHAISNATEDLQPLRCREGRVGRVQTVVQRARGHKLLLLKMFSAQNSVGVSASITMIIPSGSSTSPNTRKMFGELKPMSIKASFFNAATLLASNWFSCFTATSKPCHLARYTVPNMPLPMEVPMMTEVALLMWDAARAASLPALCA